MSYSTKTLLLATLATLMVPFHSTATSSTLFSLSHNGEQNKTPHLTLARISQAISLDGLNSESSWLQIKPIGLLHQVYPLEFSAATQPTEIRIGYDDNNIYVLAKVYDKDMAGLSRNVMSKGQDINNDDIFGVVLDPFNSGSNGYYFATNANGFKEEGLISNNDNYLGNWDGLWDVATTLSDDHWVVEIAIPFKSLSFDANQLRWGVNFFRESKTPEQKLYWTSHGKTLYPWAPEHAGSLEIDHNITQGKGLEMVVSATTQHSSSSQRPNNNETRPSLDLSYNITPSVNASVTLNTDFSATEIDEQQINFTRFSLFTPEKRQFFLQGADIFEFGDIHTNGRPFFSRKMGLAGNGEPLDINAGIKLSGQVGETRFGLLTVNQLDALNEDNSKNLSVIRVVNQLDQNWRVGAISTNGSLESDSNRLIGTDIQYRNKSLLGGETLEVKGWYQQTKDNKVSQAGKAYNLGVYLPNEYFAGQIVYSYINSTFNPGLGFVNRNNIKQTNGFLSITSPYQSNAINSLYHNLNFDFTSDILGSERSKFIGADLIDLTTAEQFYIKLSYNHFSETLSTPFDLLGKIHIPAKEYEYQQWQVSATSDSSTKFSYGLQLNSGDYFNGKTRDLSLSASANINRYFKATLYISQQKLSFPESSFTVKAVSAKFDLAISTELFWNNWIQYNNVSDNLSLYSRIAWKPSALTSFNLVLSQNYVKDFQGRFNKQQQDTIAKISYMHRF